MTFTIKPFTILAKMIIQNTTKKNTLEHVHERIMKKKPVLASEEKGEACGFVDSVSVPSTSRTALSWEEAARNISLNLGSLKQLLPVSSNCLHLSNVRLTNSSAACLANLLLALFALEELGRRQPCQSIIVNSLCHVTVTLI